MKRLIFTILIALISITSFAQGRQIWNDLGSNVVVFKDMHHDTEVVSFQIENDHTIIFYDLPKLLSALQVCSEVLDQASSTKSKKALIAGIDTIFPRAAIFWHYEDTIVGSFNNSLTPDIKVLKKQAKLLITGQAVCRLKLNEAIRNPEFSGDANITTTYTMVFNSAEQVNNLITSIQNNISAQNRRFNRMVPDQVFPRVIDRRFRPIPFNTFMNRRRPF